MNDGHGIRAVLNITVLNGPGYTVTESCEGDLPGQPVITASAFETSDRVVEAVKNFLATTSPFATAQIVTPEDSKKVLDFVPAVKA